MNDYIAALLFFLPAGVANMMPVFANKISLLNRWKTPVDFGLRFKGQRILGNNKTWRGVVSGTLMAGLTAVLISKVNINTVATVAPFWVGCLLGFGALAGDAFESFFKRLRGVKPGEPWFPFDQTDYIIGALLVVSIFVQLPLWAIVTIFVVYFGLHLLVAYGGYRLGLKDRPI
jgi:CDP-2,3-bis-(O-geranylgeranyl)-sn-glycerol synthase